MRGSVSINLSSEPFRRDRPIVAATLAGGALLLGLLVWQVSYAWIEHDAAAETRAAVAEAQRNLQRLSAEQSRLEAVLRQPENAEVLDHSVFLNALLLRKGISWTGIFSDLQDVVPHNVRLVSIRPQVNSDNSVQLEMVVGAQTPEPVIEMLMKLEGSERFGATAVTNWLPPSQSEPLYRYRVSVNYEPQL